jgi:hypothetical protein
MIVSTIDKGQITTFLKALLPARVNIAPIVYATPLVGGLLEAVLVCFISAPSIRKANINAPASTIEVGIKATLDVRDFTPAMSRYYCINIKTIKRAG